MIAVLRLLMVACAVALLGPGARAGSVQTMDNHTYEGNVRLTEGGVVTIETGAGMQKVSPDNLKVAQFGILPAGTILPRGWQAEEIGNTQGSCLEKEGRFVMRATTGVTPIQETKVRRSAEFVFRQLRGDGQLVACLESVSGPPASGLAGVMLRDTTEAVGAFVILGVTPDLKLRLENREAGWGQVNRKELGQVSLPLWLKLRRDENTVTSWRSSDGKTWQRLEQCSLNLTKEPFPEGSGEWRPRGLAGIAMANPASNQVCSAAFSQVALNALGLLGMYYADENFKNYRFSRTDPKIDFRWGRRAPGLDLPDERFSVRWLGQMEMKTTAKHTFFFETEGTAKLFVDGKELLPVTSREKKNKVELQAITLNAGEKYPVQVDFQAGQGLASIVLTCVREKVGQVPLEKAFSYTFDDKSPEEYGEMPKANLCAAKGIWLRNGSLLAGELRGADDTATRVRFFGTNELLILNSKIARINFRRLARAVPVEVAGDHSGLFLKNGDFIESDLRSVKERALTVSSVLFGRRTFNLDGAEASVLVLHGPAPSPGKFEVTLVDGSILQANAVTPKGETIVIEETSLGNMEALSKHLAQIRRIGTSGLRADLKN